MTPTQQQILWVLRAQSGDRDAMNHLFLAVQDPLDRFLRSLGADEHRAEDLLQEVFLTIYRKIRWLRDPALFRPWSFRIAHRLASRRLASEQRRLERTEPDIELELVPAEEALPDGVELTSLFEHVSPASRAVLALRFGQGMQLEEVADVLEIPLGTVKSRLGYGLSVLRRRLDGGGSANTSGGSRR